jgi:hypothetical protein
LGASALFGLCCKEGVVHHLHSELGASPPPAGSGYPLQFLSPFGASGISASIPCAAQNCHPWQFWALGLLRKPRELLQPASAAHTAAHRPPPFIGYCSFYCAPACVTSADRTALDGLLYCAPCRPGYRHLALGVWGFAPNSENQNAARFGSASCHRHSGTTLPFFAFGFLQSKKPGKSIHAGLRGAHARLKPGCIYRTYPAFSPRRAYATCV